MTTEKIKNGFTKLDNDLLEAILRYSFTKIELKIVLAIIRKTIGFNKRMDDISLSQLGKMTGVNESNISRAIRDLVAKKVLLKQQGKYASNIGINSKFQKWKMLSKQQGGCRNDKTAIVKTTTKGLSKQQTQKKPPKDNTNKKELSAFERWYSNYPLKKSRGAAEKVFRKINPDENLLSQMMQSLEKQKINYSKLKSLDLFAPEWKHPATWLNSECWLDEIDESDFNKQKMKKENEKKSAGQFARESIELAIEQSVSDSLDNTFEHLEDFG